LYSVALFSGVDEAEEVLTALAEESSQLESKPAKQLLRPAEETTRTRTSSTGCCVFAVTPFSLNNSVPKSLFISFYFKTRPVIIKVFASVPSRAAANLDILARFAFRLEIQIHCTCALKSTIM
jgi:hypothetical protein